MVVTSARQADVHKGTDTIYAATSVKVITDWSAGSALRLVAPFSPKRRAGPIF